MVLVSFSRSLRLALYMLRRRLDTADSAYPPALLDNNKVSSHLREVRRPHYKLKYQVPQVFLHPFKRNGQRHNQEVSWFSALENHE
jgi:hypothetical protein